VAVQLKHGLLVLEFALRFNQFRTSSVKSKDGLTRKCALATWVSLHSLNRGVT